MAPKLDTTTPPLVKRSSPTYSSTDLDSIDPAEMSDSGTPADWFWEGNVVAAIAQHLSETGWRIVRQANTATKERGVDLHAERRGQTLLIEAKGYPSKGYRDPARSAETKPTNPTNSA